MAAALGAGGAHAGLYSDLWFNPRESGWGLNVVQQGENAFVTLFVHGPERKPTWYVSPDARVTALGAGGLPLFEGTLYRTEGSPPGGPHQPGDVLPAGVLHLELLARDRMRVHYSLDGEWFAQEVRRQTFAETPLTGNYLGQFLLRQSRPGEPPYGWAIYPGEVLLHLDAEAGLAMLRVDDHLDRRCEYRGPYEVTGKLTQVAGSFTCTAGEALSGTFEVTDLEATANGISASLRTTSDNHRQSGRFAAVRW